MSKALVTGASRGIGRAIAETFAAQGWDVIAPSRGELDLADANAVRKWCSVHQNISFEAFVHSAGVNWPCPLAEMTEDGWAQTLQVNLTSFRQLVQAITPRMGASGRILVLSSMLSVISRPGRGAYSATKAAVNALVRTLALELGPMGVLANALCPGYVDTDLTRQNNSPEQIAALTKSIPLGRLATAQEIAAFAVWLCSSQNSYLTGQSILIDGGFTCL